MDSPFQATCRRPMTRLRILDPGDEPTDADLRKMDLIAAELDKVRGELAARYYPTNGRA